MKIAIIGSGVAGLTAAHLLHKENDITVYESNNYIGGHVNTIDLPAEATDDAPVSIDTGFIVFNDWTYPNFENLISDLDIETQDSEMSFSAKCDVTGFEWSGNNLQSLIFNRDNWKQLKPYLIFYDIVRFKRISMEFLNNTYLNDSTNEPTLGNFLESNKFSSAFIKYYILPMGAAIWSSTLEKINEYPARSFLTFFKNHGLLNLNVRPQWKTIVGGSKQYVSELIKPFRNKIFTNTTILKVKRTADYIEVIPQGRHAEHFDHIFFACHSDQALNLTENSSIEEKNILGDIQYQENIAVLHTDNMSMPKRKNAWSSWNYLVPEKETGCANVTYYMNRLQNLDCEKDYFVTLNPHKEICPSKILKVIDYMHPVFDQPAIDAQKQFSTINGYNNTWYCGAYWRNGFHEDGVWSAIRAVEEFNKSINNEQLYLQRAS